MTRRASRIWGRARSIFNSFTSGATRGQTTKAGSARRKNSSGRDSSTRSESASTAGSPRSHQGPAYRLVAAVQVIYNVFDQNPEDELFPACQEIDIAVIARVPFDEGSLTGTLSKDSRWPEGDWRNTYFTPANLTATLDPVERCIGRAVDHAAAGDGSYGSSSAKTPSQRSSPVNASDCPRRVQHRSKR